jgi:hypothetical protein
VLYLNLRNSLGLWSDAAEVGGTVDDGGADVVVDALEVNEPGVDEEAEGVCFGPVEMAGGCFDAFLGALGEPQRDGITEGLGANGGRGHGGGQRRGRAAVAAYTFCLQ